MSETPDSTEIAQLADTAEADYREGGPRTETDSTVILTTLMLASYCHQRGIRVSYDQAHGMAQHLRDRHLLATPRVVLVTPDKVGSRRTLGSLLWELGTHLLGWLVFATGVVFGNVHPWADPVNAIATGLCLSGGIGIVIASYHVRRWR